MANTIQKFTGPSLLSAEYGEQLWIDGETSYWSIDADITAEAVGKMKLTKVTDAEELALVKANSNAVSIIDSKIAMDIRESYSIEDELGALRTGDTIVAEAIAAIVAEGALKKTALGFA